MRKILSKQDYERLLENVKDGKELPKDALTSIRKQLDTGRFETDPYTLIHILGKAHDIASKDIIEKFLTYGLDDPTDDGMTRRIAIQVLGDFWGLDEFFDAICKAAFEDPSGYVRMIAASAIGHLGAQYAYLKPQAALCLVRGLEKKDEEDEVRESFHDGLHELFEVPVNLWPIYGDKFTDSDIRWDLVDKARELASELSK